MRVGVISLHASPLAPLGEGANGGLNVYVRDICQALSRLGVATDVFTRVPETSPPAVHQVTGLSRVIDIPLGAEGLDRRRLEAIIPDFAAAIVSEGEVLNYDLLWSHYWLSGLAARHLHHQFGLPWVHTGHTWGVAKNQQLAPGAELEPEQRLLAEREIVAEADLLVLSTNAEKQLLAETYGISVAEMEVIRPGVDLDIFHPLATRPAQKLEEETFTPSLTPPRPTPSEQARRGPRAGEGKDERLFITVGRLERLKGIDLAIQAIASLSVEYPSVRLLVVGGEGGGLGELGRLKKLVTELELTEHVEFAGPMEQTQLASYYAAAEASLIPSYTESFGLVGLEAQACGTPVIATRATGLAEVITEGVNGFLVGSGDSEALAQAMRCLLADPKQSWMMGQVAACIAQSFSWRSTAERLLKCFLGLAASSSEHPRRCRLEAAFSGYPAHRLPGDLGDCFECRIVVNQG